VLFYVDKPSQINPDVGYLTDLSQFIGYRDLWKVNAIYLEYPPSWTSDLWQVL